MVLGMGKEFYDSLVADRYLVSGKTAEECTAKDTYFSYAENPKTLFKYNAQQNPDDERALYYIKEKEFFELFLSVYYDKVTSIDDLTKK